MPAILGWLSAASASVALKSRLAIGVASAGCRKDLQGDVAFQPGVPGAVDLAHSAAAEGRENFVRAKTSARGQHAGDQSTPQLACVVLSATSFPLGSA